MRTAADDELMLPALRKYSLISYVPGASKTSVIDTGTGFFSISSSATLTDVPSTVELFTRKVCTAAVRNVGAAAVGHADLDVILRPVRHSVADVDDR